MWQIFVAKYLRLIYSLYSLALRFDVGGIRVFSLETTTTHASKNKWHELALFVYNATNNNILRKFMAIRTPFHITYVCAVHWVVSIYMGMCELSGRTA